MPCRLCGNPTKIAFGKLCESCWELNRNVRRNPGVVLKILIDLETEEMLSRDTSPDGVSMDECAGGGEHDLPLALVRDLHTCRKCGDQVTYFPARNHKAALRP